MKKSEIYEMIIEAVIESKIMELDSKIVALDLLFDKRSTELWCESRVEELNANS